MTTKRCPTCGGRGTVDWVPPADGAWGFGTWPQETCRNCNGSGWVGKPDYDTQKRGAAHEETEGT